MKHSLTPKLYFNKFTDCIRFVVTESSRSIRNNPVIRELKSLLQSSGTDHRTRLDWHFSKGQGIVATLNCYFTSTSLGDQLRSSVYAGLITEIVAPASDLHRDLLLGGVEIQLRDHLMYNRFRYKVQFKSGVNRSYIPIVREWVKEQFQDRKSGRKGDYLLMGNWLLSLYIMSDEDLLMTKLSLEEYIYSIIRVDTFAEHGIDPDSLNHQP
jgi:hypothetical protein